MEAFENGELKRVTCHRFLSKMADGLVMLIHAKSQVPVIFIVFERFSVDRRKH